MAYINEAHCRTCKKTTTHQNGNCCICQFAKLQERIAKWNAQTTDDKLQDLRRRVETLEAGPPRY